MYGIKKYQAMKNIFRQPAEPFSLFSYSDFLILSIMFLIIYWILEKRILRWNAMTKVILGISLFLIIPVLSCQIELNNVHNKFVFVEAFNVLYVYLKFPIWWMIGLFTILFIRKK